MSTLGSGEPAFYRKLVATSGGVLPGKHMLRGFVMLEPESEPENQLQLLADIDDAEHVAPPVQAFAAADHVGPRRGRSPGPPPAAVTWGCSWAARRSASSGG